MPISPTLPDYKVITETCACQPARGQGTRNPLTVPFANEVEIIVKFGHVPQ